ncbi:MAG: CBS domain-containing protein [Planctomycetes bacterium]|nr:CBS domain-containing protein [Planctomycetota bacterium]
MKPWTEAKAGDVMSTPIHTVEMDTPIREAARHLSDHKISGALVVDFNGKPAGVVSLFDIATALAGLDRLLEQPGSFYRYGFPKFKEGGADWEGRWEEVETDPLRETEVSEIMTAELITVPEHKPLQEVARAMWEREIHRVIVTKDEKPVGIVSTMDILGALVEGPRTKAKAKS